jgi:tetratricopeptide (TPR) repeat protein
VWRRDWFRLVITSALVLLLFGAGDDRARSQGSLAEANQLIVEVEALWGGYEQAAIDVKLRQALAIREAQLGPNHPLVADVIGRLGRNSWNQGDLNAAEQMFRRALNIFQQGGRDAFNIARLQGDLGATLREKGSYPEAEKLVRNSVAMRRGLNPPNPLFVAAGLDNLGRVLAAQRRLPEAKAAIEESLALRRSALSAQDVMVQQSETLLNALQDAIDPWRVVFRVGWICWYACSAWSLSLATMRTLRERAVTHRLPSCIYRSSSDVRRPAAMFRSSSLTSGCRSICRNGAVEI